MQGRSTLRPTSTPTIAVFAGTSGTRCCRALILLGLLLYHYIFLYWY
ncbi:gp46 [Burkholderia phage BcepB1A]|nr:gp46 [Burkholderia phage BcepB1A]AAY87916.1 gp46 [Burkholderia phage BcepB1A]